MADNDDRSPAGDDLDATSSGQPPGQAAEAAAMRVCGSHFLKALELLQSGDQDEAQRSLKAVVAIEPRLPEPHLELAVIHYRKGQLDEAIEEARMGLDLLERGGQWLDNLSSGEMLCHARNLLGELLVKQAERDALELSPDAMKRLWDEAVGLFEAAVDADPSNETARKNALRHRWSR